MSDGKTLTYQKAGVDPEKASRILTSFAGFLKGRPKDSRVLSGIGPFASCFSLKEILAENEDPVLVTCCDGVGTKAKLALEWGKIEQLGEDLVAMNINDLLCVGATPAVFLDYYACGTLREDQLLPLLKSIQRGCELAHCSLVGGETAEMPGIYAGEDFDLAGFAVGFVDRKKILGPERVELGDRILALESSGAHSNGYSLVRKILERDQIKGTDVTPFGGTWAEALLRPTTIYVSALDGLLPQIHALAHLTGGGLFENLPRVLPKGFAACVEESRWPLPALFAWLKERAGISLHELLSTFNCGVGMIAICAPDRAEALQRTITERGVRCWPIGTIQKSTHAQGAGVLWG